MNIMWINKEYKAEEIKKEFLEYLDKNKIPHIVVSDVNNSLTVALPREGGDEFITEKARQVVGGFEDGRKLALFMEAYYQKKTEGISRLKSEFALHFTKTGREIRQNIKKLKYS